MHTLELAKFYDYMQPKNSIDFRKLSALAEAVARKDLSQKLSLSTYFDRFGRVNLGVIAPLSMRRLQVW